MKVIHIESGLGNQMLSFCEYLVAKKMNPNDDVYIETIIYEIPECNKVICQWNGYELEKIFGIKVPNIKDLFTEKQWQNIICEVRASKFWEKNWNYPVYIVQALNNAGLQIVNMRGDFEKISRNLACGEEATSWMSKLKDSYIGYTLKRWNNHIREKKYIEAVNHTKEIFIQTPENVFLGQFLSLKMRGNRREEIDNEIHKSFIFPQCDDKSKSFISYIEKFNAVAIHARRGDMLTMNGWCYKYGYFKRATKYIRKYVDNPIFIFFTDPSSIQWCKENQCVFGLDFSKDKILFVDWNTGEYSYRDIQIMSHCKHAIITNSSFGWWGAYFISNPQKITISPFIEIDTTYHC